MDDWLFRLKDEYDAQQQEYTHALDDLKAQEEQDQYQALADLMSGAGPEIDFSKLGTHGTAADALDAYGTEIARRALQAKVDIMANYADAAGSLRDEQERSRQDYR